MRFAAARALLGLGSIGLKNRYWKYGLRFAGGAALSALQRRHNRRNRSLARMAYFKPRRWRRRYWRGYSRRRIYR